MHTETEGIVLKNIKTSYNRKMLLLFTKKFGKISAGTSISERSRGKSALGIKSFTYCRYGVYKNRENFNVDSAEVIRSFYGLGENVDKFMYASYVMEFTEKVLQEGAPAPEIFNLLIDFLDVLEKREKGFGSLVLAYQVQLFKYAGVLPELDNCTVCSKKIDVKNAGFSIKNGGAVCPECMNKLLEHNVDKSGSDELIYSADFDILAVIRCFVMNPLKRLDNFALNRSAGQLMQRIIRQYAEYYLDASNIKSERLI